MFKDLVLDLLPKPEHSGVFTTWLVLAGQSSLSCLAVTVGYFGLGPHNSWVVLLGNSSLLY